MVNNIALFLVKKAIQIMRTEFAFKSILKLSKFQFEMIVITISVLNG
jgi:hypothetical protein